MASASPVRACAGTLPLAFGVGAVGTAALVARLRTTALIIAAATMSAAPMMAAAIHRPGEAGL
ncbi:hypothetical protein [Mycobacterium marinum]|uniref:hypothetical protein n=1 Tax=Mycobacterium marinum TaxID=1781 RepID=UPI003564127E